MAAAYTGHLPDPVQHGGPQRDRRAGSRTWGRPRGARGPDPARSCPESGGSGLEPHVLAVRRDDHTAEAHADRDRDRPREAERRAYVDRRRAVVRSALHPARPLRRRSRPGTPGGMTAAGVTHRAGAGATR